jgi:hypothetical protein
MGGGSYDLAMSLRGAAGAEAIAIRALTHVWIEIASLRSQ